MPIGVPELLIVLVIVLVVFGAGKLAGVGGALGRSVRDFRTTAMDDQGTREPGSTSAGETDSKDATPPR